LSHHSGPTKDSSCCAPVAAKKKGNSADTGPCQQINSQTTLTSLYLTITEGGGNKQGSRLPRATPCWQRSCIFPVHPRPLSQRPMNYHNVQPLIVPPCLFCTVPCVVFPPSSVPCKVACPCVCLCMLLHCLCMPVCFLLSSPPCTYLNKVHGQSESRRVGGGVCISPARKKIFLEGQRVGEL